MDKGMVMQHRATILPNVGIAYVLGMILLTVGVSAAVAFTTKSLSYFIYKLDRCYPQLNLIALCFI